MNLKETITENENSFLEKGYIVKDIENKEYLEKISNSLFEYSKEILGSNFGNSSDLDFFNKIHNNVSVKDLNDFRVKLINNVNATHEIKKKLYNISKSLLHELVGNELAVQRRLNLSIQFPNDDSSLLPVHADTWSGDSPFEIVTWLPLVDCYKTKSMYILPPKYYEDLKNNFAEFANKSAADIFDKISDKIDWIDIKFGQIMLFNQSLPHGNVVNKIPETRWSINCRFKSLFTPYGDKKLGEFFEPISTKVMSKIGMNYSHPST